MINHESVKAKTESTERLKSPFPYAGGKSRVSGLVWPRFGDVPNYVEPFAGSIAMLLARPTDHKGTCETDMKPLR